MKILHFSDFHLRPNKQGERSMDLFNRMMDKLQEINQEANIDLVIFLGDMIDKGQEYATIVIKALDSAFDSHGFHRSGSAERFGIEEKRDYMPSHQEVWDYWYA